VTAGADFTVSDFDGARAETFGGRMLEALNHATTVMMLSVGDRLGLFDTLAGLGPATSEKLAAAAGLEERYVREWLGALVVAEVVEYEPAPRTYLLPPEHAATLTSAAGVDNLAFFAQYVPLLSAVEDELLDAFRHGGGVPYSSYPRFQAVQAQETSRVYDATLVDITIPLVPGARERLEAGIDVIDVGCGSGHAVNVMAKAFPQSRFHGLDMSDEGIAAARAEATAWGLTNVRFEVGDATSLSAASFDLVTAFDMIHDLARPAEVLAAVAAAVRPDGVFLMVDMAASSRLEENIGHPFGPLLYGFSLFHCMTVSLAQDGAGLGTVWGEQLARQMLAEAGFGSVETTSVEGDPLNLYYICRRHA
jgi:winged helix-turn-helix protein/methyltransferase family protein